MLKKAVSNLFVIILMVLTNSAITGCAYAGPQTRLEKTKPADRSAKVDKNGVLRWQDTGKEVALFGVNYCAPSASAYRMIKKTNIPHEQAIDKDIAHLARMGLDAIRLSFWGDRECSDEKGNLVNNHHLQLLDYLIYKAKSRGIYLLFTPIVHFNSLWPDALDKPEIGLSGRYDPGKAQSDPNAIKAQANYLRQILNHVNPYTKLAYKDEPAILVVELYNEPWHQPDKIPQTIKYLNTLVDAVRSTGCQKPIFYNVSQEMKIAPAIRDSKVDGATFGWYPADLINGWSLRGNFLPNVAAYPQMLDENLTKKAKWVYEFDTADIDVSFMYPAMARTFRTSGIQLATQFTYDPLVVASKNAEFQTHYLNLAYTPKRAVSFIIANQVFHQLPMYKSYGKFPASNQFGPFRVSYEQDLSEMVTDRIFMYSNDTTTRPPKAGSLKRIVGCGSSPVVSYEGTGAYFLDKLKGGLWRLEVYPDTVLLRDPFGKISFDREVTAVFWNKRSMKLNLPSLGKQFSIEPLNKGNSYSTKTENGGFTIQPGVYLLKQKGIDASGYRPSTPFGQISLGEFVAPAQTNPPVTVLHEPFSQAVVKRSLTIEARVVSADSPEKVILNARYAVFPIGWPNYVKSDKFTMKQQEPYLYTAQIPAEKMKKGLLEYCITVQTKDKVRTFPADIQWKPDDWDFPAVDWWQNIVVEQNAPLVLFDAIKNRNRLIYSHWWRGIDYNVSFVPSMTEGKVALRIDTKDFKQPLNPKLPPEVSCSYFFGNELETRRQDLSRAKAILLRARAGKPDTTSFAINLIETDGTAWAAIVPLTANWRQIRIPLAELKLVKSAMIPQGWPEVNPYWQPTPAGRGGKKDKLKIDNLQAVQITFGARLMPERVDRPHAIEVESIALEMSD